MWLLLLLAAIVTGAVLAITTAPSSTQPVPAIASEPSVERSQPIKPPAATHTPAPPPKRNNARTTPTRPSASPSTLEHLALIGQATKEQASACFRDAWLDGRLTDDHVALHMTVDPTSSGQPLHVTAPNTDEHLWDAEACLAALYAQQTDTPSTDQAEGMIWSLRLPTAQWADEINDGRSL